MNTSSEQLESIKTFISIGKYVLLVFGVIFGLLLGFLSFLKIIDFNSAATMSVIYSALAFVVSVTFLIFQKRMSINSTLGLIIGILFVLSSIMLGYSNTLSFPEKAYTNQIGIGSGVAGLGLTIMTFSLIISSLNKLGMASRFKYSKFLMVWFIVCGLPTFIVGIYTLVLGYGFLLNG